MHRALILGAGITGRSAARWLRAAGWRVVVTERSGFELQGTRGVFDELKSSEYRADYIPVRADRFDLVLRSPGVRESDPALRAARALGIPVVSELDLPGPDINRPMVAVTGTNGKGSVSSYVGHFLSASTFDVPVVGNIGRSFTLARSEMPPDRWLVVEVSAAQLEDTNVFSPFVGVITNVVPEHMDRYTWQQYKSLKAHLGNLVRADGTLVVCADDAVAVEIGQHHEGEVMAYSGGSGLGGFDSGVVVEPSGVVSRHTKYGVETWALPPPLLERLGRANLAGALAATLAAGRSFEQALKRVGCIGARPHAFEMFLDDGSTVWIDDAKATNPYSTVHALEKLKGVTSAGTAVLIVGGEGSKRPEFGSMLDAIEELRPHVICVDDTGLELYECLTVEKLPSLSYCETIEAAVGVASDIARKSQQRTAVLYSPGANSYDARFAPEPRGKAFKEVVRRRFGA